MKNLSLFLEEKINLLDNGDELFETEPAYKLVKSVVDKYSAENNGIRLNKVYKQCYKYDGLEDRFYYNAEIYGGTNGGDGTWTEYFNAISKIVSEIDKCWLIDLINDPADDVFTLRIGFNLTDKN